MKQIFTLLLGFFISATAFAQSNISIQINHLLDGVQFENNVASENNLKNDFLIDRLEYYISGFSITHDGGQVTTIDDLYVLVSLINKTDPTLIDLGAHDVTVLEAVSFYFGIDEETNHSDPSLWEVDHPLAPKFPSMHWGWNAGYRFIALEGLSGPNMDLEMQFHGIGDEYYEEMTFDVMMSGEDSYTVILDAEYSKLLASLDISEGIILHGTFEEIGILIDNLKQDVFTLGSPVSIDDHEKIKQFDVYPNPATNGLINWSVEVEDIDYVINVYNTNGQLISSEKETANKINIENPGMYFVVLQGLHGNTLAVRKITVQ